MNCIFTDYDFSDTHPDSFQITQESDVMRIVNSYLGEITISRPSFLIELWQAINDVIRVHECTIYSYIPQLGAQDHPFSGSLWCFNFFFVNKELRRICYFSCIGSTQVLRSDPYDICDDDDEEDSTMDYESDADDY